MSDHDEFQDERLSRLYRAASTDVPSPQLDTAIRDVARREALKRSRVPWRPALATAAVLLLTVGVALQVLEQLPVYSESELMQKPSEEMAVARKKETAPSTHTPSQGAVGVDSTQKEAVAVNPPPPRPLPSNKTQQSAPVGAVTEKKRSSAAALKSRSELRARMAPAGAAMRAQPQADAAASLVVNESAASFSSVSDECGEFEPPVGSKEAWQQRHQSLLEQRDLNGARCLREAYAVAFDGLLDAPAEVTADEADPQKGSQ